MRNFMYFSKYRIYHKQIGKVVMYQSNFEK